MVVPLLAFLHAQIDRSARDVRPLGAGMFARAYRFSTDNGHYVIRLGTSAEAFRKDQLAYDRLGHALPIPPVLRIGPFDDAHTYCISGWRPGRPLARIRRSTHLRLLPDLFALLWAMRNVVPPDGLAAGILNATGQPRRAHPRGAYATWADYVGAVDDFAATFTPRAGETYRPWAELVATTFLSANVVTDARRRLARLLPLLPNARHYVHGDFGYDNVLTDGHRITAVLDWAEMRIGDPLYDVAYLAYYDEDGIDYVSALTDWLAAHNRAEPHLRERIRAYQWHILLGDLFLTANRHQADWHAEALGRYARLVAEADNSAWT